MKFWLQGSPFLQLSQEDWLSTKNFEKSNESHCLEELSSSGIDADTKNIFSFEKYNSFQNLIRITSFVDQLQKDQQIVIRVMQVDRKILRVEKQVLQVDRRVQFFDKAVL